MNTENREDNDQKAYRYWLRHRDEQQWRLINDNHFASISGVKFDNEHKVLARAVASSGTGMSIEPQDKADFQAHEFRPEIKAILNNLCEIADRI